MPRSVSAAFKNAVFASETDKVFLVLLTITPNDETPGAFQPIYLVLNTVNIVSNGNTHIATAFRVTLPVEVPGQPARARIRLDNIDRSITQSLRGLTRAPNIAIEIVMHTTPDIVEYTVQFSLRRFKYDVLFIEADLDTENVLQEPYPGDYFDTSRFPGIF